MEVGSMSKYFKILRLRNIAILALTSSLLAGCGQVSLFNNSDINTKTKFSSSEYGVAASKRVTTSKNIPKGGGRKQIGKPYKIAGKWYYPKYDPNYDKTGVASWYGPNFHGRKTANGEIFDQYAISAAHPTLPLPSYVRVTNLENNRSMIVRVNDRGPFSRGRIIDLSKRVAEILGVKNKGTARVRVKYVAPAPLEGDDTKMLLASLNKPISIEKGRKQTIKVASIPSPQTKIRTNNITISPQGFFIVNNNQNNQLGPLFYAASKLDNQQSNDLINSAFAATKAMATRSEQLLEWRDRVDQEARKINLTLGVFSKKENSEKVALAFALLGAVDESEVIIAGKRATKLTLTQLKSGVTRRDVLELAQNLGLKNLILN